MNPWNAVRDVRTIGALLGEAERTARRMGDEEPRAEHLLLAALTMADGAAARAMGRLDVTPRSLEQAIVEAHAAGLVSAGVEPESAARLARSGPIESPERPGVYRSDPSAQALFQAAGSLARGARQRLSSAHVVLAVADVEYGTLGRVLDRLKQPSDTSAMAKAKPMKGNSTAARPPLRHGVVDEARQAVVAARPWPSRASVDGLALWVTTFWVRTSSSPSSSIATCVISSSHPDSETIGRKTHRSRVGPT